MSNVSNHKLIQGFTSIDDTSPVSQIIGGTGVVRLNKLFVSCTFPASDDGGVVIITSNSLEVATIPVSTTGFYALDFGEIGIVLPSGALEAVVSSASLTQASVYLLALGYQN